MLRRLPPLPMAAALTATSLVAAWLTWQAAAADFAHPFFNDFRNYYGAALVGERDGWSRLYDFAAQASAAKSIGAYWQPFANPPPMAWLAAPFTALPFGAALVAWMVLLIAATLGAWWLAAPEGAWPRALALTAALAFFPLVFALQIAQSAVLVLFAVAACWALLARGRDVEAGLVLALLVLKPQVAILAPLALLAAGRLRPVAGFAVGAGLLTAASVLTLGSAGVAAYLHATGVLAGLDIGRHYALGGLLGSGPLALAARILAGALAVLAAVRNEARIGRVLTAGVLGSLLAAPYLSLQDYCLLVPCAWFLFSEGNRRWLPVLVGIGLVAGLFAIPLGGWPLVLVTLAALTVLALNPRSAPSGRPGSPAPAG